MSTVTNLSADPLIAQRAAADPTVSSWVSASAGTGKTKVLTDRVLSLMLAGTEPGRILCLTYTRAAAAEMATRIAATLGAWATDTAEELDEALQSLLGEAPDDAHRHRARRLFARVLDTPGGLGIQTIHAFCQSLLGRFPLEAAVSPHFMVMEERDAREALSAAWESVLARARDNADGVLANALAEVTLRIHETRLPTLIAALSAARGALKRLFAGHEGSVDRVVEAVRARLGLAPGDTAETIVATACRDDAFEGLLLVAAASALADWSKSDKDRAALMVPWLAAAREHRVTDFDAYARAYLTADPIPTLRNRLITKDALAASPGTDDVLAAEGERLLGVLERRRAAITAVATGGLLRLAGALLDAYEARKRSRALLDYDDLILKARGLLETPGTAPWVLYKLDGGIDHVLIDEAQDTSPDQWAIVRALTGEFFAGEGAREDGRTVFAVGDVKQSIYSFQGAEPGAFRGMQDHFGEAVPAAGRSWRPVALSVSFRSTRAVLGTVDAVFSGAAAKGVSLDGMPIDHTAHRARDGGLVEVWAPVDVREEDAPPPWKPPVEAVPGDAPRTRLAAVLARRIHRMVHGENLESRDRPIHAGDIMVLVRRRGAFVEDLVRMLKQRGVEVAGVDRMVLTDQLAVMDLIALGQVLVMPGDDLTLAAVLKGPLVGLSEEDLFRLAHGRPGTLWDALRAHRSQSPAFAAAHGYLADLMARADYEPPFELYARILGPLEGRVRLISRLGHEAEDPIAEFLDLALSFERQHAAALQSFLHWVSADEVEIKRDLEHDARDAVRVMTVHGAKGLQAPVVILPDTLQKPRNERPLLWPEDGAGGRLPLWPPSRDAREAVAEAEKARLDALADEEYRRLLYVAMTRAEDRLYICGWRTRQNPPQGCWYQLVREGMETADGVEEIEDPHLAADGDMDDGRVLRLICAQEGPPDTRRPQEPAPGTEEPPPHWFRQPPAPERLPHMPLAPSRPEGEEPAVRSPFDGDDGRRFQRGRLIHRLLQTLPNLPLDRRRAAAQRFLAQGHHGLDAEAQAAIVAETIAVLEDPRFGALFGPDSLAEAAVAGAMGETVIVGQVDRLVVTDDCVTIVDYKTNRPPPREVAEVPAVYLRQMAAYRQALGDIYPDRPVTCVLLWTDGPDLMALPTELLDHHAP